MVFYLTKGSLKVLQESKSLYAESTQCIAESDTATIRPTFDNRPIIAQVIKTKYIEFNKEHYDLTLYDNETKLRVRVSMISLSSVNTRCNKLNIQTVKAGSVIILNEYKLIFDKIKQEDPIILITNFYLIGHEEPLENDEEDPKLFIPTQTHKLNELTSNIEKQNWTVYAMVVDKTPVKDFMSKSANNEKKQFVRILLADSTGYIEALAYDRKAIELSEKLKINKVYSFTYCEVKEISQKGYLTWPKQKHKINYDLLIRVDSFVFCVSDEKMEIILDNPNQVDENNNQVDNNNKVVINNNAKNKFQDNLVKIDSLIYCKFNSLINVIGIVKEIKERGFLDKMSLNRDKPLSLTKFVLIDDTKTLVNVALWGKETEDFNYPAGTIIYLKNIKITNYDGLSLSVLRCTIMRKITDFSRDIRANELKN